MDGLASASTPAVFFCPRVPKVRRNNQPHAFWPEPVSVVWLCRSDDACVQFISIRHAIQPSPLDCLTLAAQITPSQVFSRPEGRGYIVPAASDRSVARFAGAGTLLRTEPQVLSWGFLTVNNSLHQLTSIALTSLRVSGCLT